MKTASLCFAAACLLSTTANAALELRLGGLAVYDSDLNITWLADANLAPTNSFGVASIAQDAQPYTFGIRPDGTMTWDTAQSWIGAINSNNYLGYNDWRLPNITDTGLAGCNHAYIGSDCGSNVNTAASEMAHLFYDELGNKAYYDSTGAGPQVGWGLTNTAPFINLLSGYYWSGTTYALDSNFAWYFGFWDGSQDAFFKSSTFNAMAVRNGDVAAVPIPTAAWLLGSGLLGLIGMAKRKK